MNLEEATVRALQGKLKLNEWKETGSDEYGDWEETKYYEIETDDGFLDERFDDEEEAVKFARKQKGDVAIYVSGSGRYTSGEYADDAGDPLESVLLWQRKDGVEKSFGNSNIKTEDFDEFDSYTGVTRSVDDNTKKDIWRGAPEDYKARLDSLTDFACDWCGGVFKVTYPTKRNGNKMPTCPYCGMNKDVHKLNADYTVNYEN